MTKIVGIEDNHPPKDELLRVEWNLGRRCNYNCSYCGNELHDNGHHRENSALQIEDTNERCHQRAQVEDRGQSTDGSEHILALLPRAHQEVRRTHAQQIAHRVLEGERCGVTQQDVAERHE